MIVVSTAELAAELGAGRTSAVALTEAALERIEQVNPEWNVFITVMREEALTAAGASDRRRSEGVLLGPLDGIPVAIKDNLDVFGVPTSNGTALRSVPAAADSFAAAKLREAGAVILGKLNMHEGALGATTDNAHFGRCANPRVPGATPGGSSGGSAAAVAGGLVPIALGTDTMGSVRIPAAYCGVWGLKPTRGLVGTSGLVPLSWTFDTIGPLANSAEDLSLAITALAGHDPDDPASVDAPSGWSAGSAPIDFRHVTLGIPAGFAIVDMEDGVRAAFEECVGRLRRAGATVKDVVIDSWEPSRARRAGLLVAEAEAGSGMGLDMDREPQAFSQALHTLIAYGRNAKAERLAAAYRALDFLRLRAEAVLATVDAIILPTAPQVAFPNGTAAPDNQADFTSLANFAFCPAVAFPLAGAGVAPASAQLIGRRFSEFRLLALAQALESLQ